MASAISVTATNRVIALVDMDCFYVQVEERDDPLIKGVPAAVVQYKAFKGGGIIAVNYEARAKGVTRNMRGDDAKAVCPEIKLVRVPESRGKADLTKYRDAGREVINVLTDFSSCVERASIDEAYIDLTEAVELRLAEISSQDKSLSWSEHVVGSLNMDCLTTNFVLGYDSTNDWLDSLTKRELPSVDDFKLAVGAEIVGKMRDAVYQRTNFRCSAGIAHNKVLAKLVCGINKPNKQTILPHESVANLWSRTKIGKVRGLGGKLGEYVEGLGCVHMSDLKKFSEKDLSAVLGSKTGAWLFQLSRGYDDEAVIPRQLPKSIGCNKNFYGPEALKTKDKTKFWINQLANEVVERIQRDLETNNRRAKTLTLHVKFENQNHLSRSCGVPQYNADRMAADVFSFMEKLYQSVGVLPINSLGLIASKFEDEVDISGCTKINDFFKIKSSSKTSETSESSIVTGVDDDIYTECSNDSISSLPLDSSSLKSTIAKHEVVPGTSKGLYVMKQMVSETEFVPVIDNTEQKSSDTTAIGAHRTKTDQTPTKVDPTSDDLRKPFFQFVEKAPKPSSPLKSPRRLMNPLASHDKSDNLPSVNVFETNATVLKECERCGKKLAEWDLSSHMDFHFAKDLSREINGLPPLVSETAKKNVVTESNNGEKIAKVALKRPRGRGTSATGSKRGRGAKTTATSISVPTTNSRTIDSYFVPKT